MLCSGVEGLSRECPKASNVPVPCSDLTFTSADLTKTILSSDRHMFFSFLPCLVEKLATPYKKADLYVFFFSLLSRLILLFKLSETNCFVS